MADKEVILTHEGIEELEKNLEYLKTVKRLEIAEQIKVARAFGDISENAEYDEAKNEQARIESEIANIEKMLSLAKVIDEKKITTSVVGLGSVIKVLDMEFNEEMEFSIVGTAEANPSMHKVSNESPFGQAMIGKKKGSTVEVECPSGIVKYKILNIGK